MKSQDLTFTDLTLSNPGFLAMHNLGGEVFAPPPSPLAHPHCNSLIINPKLTKLGINIGFVVRYDVIVTSFKLFHSLLFVFGFNVSLNKNINRI